MGVMPSLNFKKNIVMNPSVSVVRIVILMISILVAVTSVIAQELDTSEKEGSAKGKISIDQWLVLPPHALSFPVFHRVENINSKTFSDADFLNFSEYSFEGHFPEEGITFATTSGEKLNWKAVATDSEGKVNAAAVSSEPQVIYMATYIWAERWLSANFEARGAVLLKAWLDGEEIGTKSKPDTLEEKPGSIRKSLKLERGSHLLLLKVVIPAGKSVETWISASLEVKDPFRAGDILISLSPKNRKNINHILDGLKVSGISLSPDGKYYLIRYSRSQPSGDQSESWAEIRLTENRQVVESYRHSRVSQLRWLPNSNRVSYTVSQNQKTAFYIHDIEKGTVVPVITDVEKFAGYDWSPDESFILYSIREEPSEKEGVMRHIQGMPDRQPGWRNRTFLVKHDLVAGKSTRLTWGNLSTSLQDISPDGTRILFSQHYSDFTERPYSKQNLFIMHLATCALDTILHDNPWSISASFSPDGKHLIATGGPEAFNGTGLNISEDLIPHNSDTQVYLYELASGNVRSITKNFNPSVSSVHWHPVDNHLYMVVVEEDHRYLYRYDLKREQFSRVETGHDFISTVSFANKALIATFGANNTNSYPCWYRLDLRRDHTTPLECAESENYRHVEFGDVKQWDFTATTGVEIKGRVYYPPGFDPERKYPVIVYYYGGITPVGRTFGGRYPFNLWAGNDYLVYVLQPGGAIGFGQEFSAAHVNNWGFTVADEIIEGTKKFLEAHPFADRSKVGCAGASYGGFMTMLLLTRTDIFAAAMSHAGISSISSYWGEGFWGYAYSAGASAFSFPWNNKELYIGQSPLFHADKIITPLLLITGDDDTNVPPGESIQMYTALKLLDRPVELVLVKGENHHILTYSKRILWHNTIMAWWDKYLKGQPEWWEELY